MNGVLNVTTKILAYGDPSVSSNPRLKFVDWLRDIPGVPVSDPKSEAHVLLPGTSKTIFDGLRSTTIDVTTTFDSSLSTIDASRYRFTWTGGTNPGFRTSRSLALNGVAVTFTAQANATMLVTVPAGPDFTTVQIGDVIFIPHTTTGDSANVISVLNAGQWSVLGKAGSTSLTLVRPTGQDFQGISQTVTLTSNDQLRAFSAAGVQIGEYVDITAGFSLPVRKSFQIVNVTDSWFEVMSTTALPTESGIITGNAGMSFYTDHKTFVYVEASQDCAVRVNGDVGNFQRLAPADPSNSDQPGQYMRRGPTWSLTVTNLSAVDLNVTIIHCE